MDIKKTAEFDRWFRRMKDKPARAAMQARIKRIGLHGVLVGDWKPVGDGVVELRFSQGPGYRIYLAMGERSWILLLAGGDKSTQRRDIDRAKRLASEWRSQNGCRNN